MLKQARNNLIKKVIFIKREYRRNQYKNMSEEDKQKLKEYQKNICCGA